MTKGPATPVTVLYSVQNKNRNLSYLRDRLPNNSSYFDLAYNPQRVIKSRNAEAHSMPDPFTGTSMVVTQHAFLLLAFHLNFGGNDQEWTIPIHLFSGPHPYIPHVS